MIKILVADDHTIIRQGIRQIVGSTSDITLADEASSAREAWKKISEHTYDVVLLDISMPDSSGLDFLKQIKHEKPNLPVLILTMHPERQYAIRALKAGASGYLTKESAPDELIAAIRKVHGGGKYISSVLAEKLAYILEKSAEELPHETLSDREYQIMCMIAKGKRLKDIADDLYLSPKTVSTYRSRILEKMNMKNNEGLIRYAIDNHLVG